MQQAGGHLSTCNTLWCPDKNLPTRQLHGPTVHLYDSRLNWLAKCLHAQFRVSGSGIGMIHLYDTRASVELRSPPLLTMISTEAMENMLARG